MPLLHASPVVQCWLSSQAVPSCSGWSAHWPVEGSHALSTHSVADLGQWTAAAVFSLHTHWPATVLSQYRWPVQRSVWPFWHSASVKQAHVCSPGEQLPAPSQVSFLVQAWPSSQLVPTFTAVKVHSPDSGTQVC